MTVRIALIFLFLFGSTFVSATELKDESLVKVLKACKISEADFGGLIVDEHDQPRFDINSGKLLIPASISKLATASAVLDKFPAGTKFKTRLMSPAKIEKGVLKGALYLVGGGDPSFVSENMWYLVNSFKRTNINQIEGDLIVDDTLFDPVRFDESRQEQRVDRAFDAPVGAMSFNWNSINIFVRPAGINEKALVYLDPENTYTELINLTKTVKGEKVDVQADRKENSNADESEKVTVSGEIGVHALEKVIYKNITKPDLWSGINAVRFLSERGIKILGSVKIGRVPSDSVSLADVESKPIEHILSDMDKFSNNYVAEMLTKLIASTAEKPATLSKGTSLIQEHLKKIGLNEKESIFLNPSGLTRKNQFSPQAIMKILKHQKKNFTTFPEFVMSLPIAGRDGTLKKRMIGTVAEGKIRAKTGLLTGVVSLAGYIGKESGDIWPFVMIYNGSKDGAQVRSCMDQILINSLKIP